MFQMNFLMRSNYLFCTFVGYNKLIDRRKSVLSGVKIMNRHFIWLLLIVFLVSCQQKHNTQMPIKKMKQESVVIDYPAIVVIGGQGDDNLNKRIATQKMGKIPIQVFDSLSAAYIFVKSNGDRVSIVTEDLMNKYDVILFNRENNPMPCRIDDLGKVLSHLFPVSDQSIESKKDIKLFSSTKSKEIAKSAADTCQSIEWFSKKIFLRQNPKRIILLVSDTSSVVLAPRTIVPVEWIIHKVDSRRFLKVKFENDLITFANTDRYYTNGIAIELQSPHLANFPLSRMMFPYKKASTVNYTAGIYQDMFTPTDTRVAPTLNHDRPYASYLYLGYRKSMANVLNKFRLTSEIDLGYLGPFSPGSYMQTLVHKSFPTNDVPLGWETQIRTDVIANYSLTIEKALVSKQNILLSANANLKAGTLINSTGAGLQLVYGKFEPFYGETEIKNRPEILYNIFAKANVNTIAQNALLQGGLLNKNNVFTLKGSDISRCVGNAEIGLQFRYKFIGIELAQHFLTPEYKKGLWHKWGRISLIFQLH